MAEVVVDAKDLKALVQLLINFEIESRCHIAGINTALVHNPLLHSRVADEMERAKPQAGDAVFLRYRELMDALESDKDIRSALANFAHQEGYS